MEKKIVPTVINFRKSEIGAILVNHFENKRKTRIAWILAVFLLLGTCALNAAEVARKENPVKQIASIEGRGALNFLTSPAEFVYTIKTEKKAHPKAWPLTYIPRTFGNIATRVTSSVNDFLVLPWYVRESGPAPLTKHFDLPDYVWQKE
jgi:hypothetical protein